MRFQKFRVDIGELYHILNYIIPAPQIKPPGLRRAAAAGWQRVNPLFPGAFRSRPFLYR
jgi:hypothetical protein